MEKTKKLVCATWKSKTAAAVLAVIAAVALPQVFHYLGLVAGLGSALGETFLPMHIAIFLVGAFAGPWAGLAAGAASPLVSFGLTTLLGTPMPAAAMLPYMVIELAVYGLTTGLLASKRVPAFAALLIAQVAGRGVRALAIVMGAYLFSSPVGIPVIWNSVLTGLPGIVLQWALVPLIVFYVEKKTHAE